MKNLKKTPPNPFPLVPVTFLRPYPPPSSDKVTKVAKPAAKNKPLLTFTVVASKKTFKTAIARNKARRRIKEAYRIAQKELGVDNEKSSHRTLRINANIQVLTADFENLKNIIKKEIQKYV